MSSARRSERLRRKRQSTPGLSQPGAYSLHGNGYIVESEISALPSSQNAKESRRMRYKDSPHRFLAEESAAAAEDEEGEVVPGTPEMAGAGGVADKVRVSLFDILGSAARRPVNARWRTAAGGGGRRLRNEEEVVEDVDEGVGDGGVGKMRPIVMLLVMFVCGMGVLLVLDGRVKERKGVGRAAWRSIGDGLEGMGGWVDGEIGEQVLYGVKVVIRNLLRNAWRRESMEGEYVSREELESVILPTLLTEARRAGAEEAARISRDLNPGKGRDSGDDFVSISERYAADKGLPADYALASFGATVISSWPSMLQLYVRCIRERGLSLLGQSGKDGIRYKNAWPLGPMTMLQPEVLPGNCWAFPGSRGSVTIQLARPVRPTSVTVEHTPRGSASSIAGALKEFRVWGIGLNASGVAVEEGDMQNLGQFVFDMSDNRRHLQSFVLNGGRTVDRMRAIRLEIVGNHGSPQTCVYRFRVHGVEQ